MIPDTQPIRVLMIGGDPNVLNPATPAGKRIEEYRRAFGELSVLLAHGRVLNFIAAFFKGKALMRRQKFDVITAQSPEHWFLAWMLSRRFRVPWQAQVHTDIFNPHFKKQSWKNKIRVLFAIFLLPRADGIRVVSERIKNSILRTPHVLKDVRRPPIDVLPIYIDIERFRTAKSNDEYPGEFLILTVARLEPEKNLPLAIRAVADVIMRTLGVHADGGRPIRYVIIGSGGEDERLHFLIKQLNMEDRIAIKQIDSAFLPGWYKRADLFLLTSNYEGYGMAAIEAAATGTPIVMTDVGVALGDVVPVNDQKAVSRAIFRQIEGGTKPPQLPYLPTKEGYLKKYKEALEKLIETQ